MHEHAILLQRVHVQVDIIEAGNDSSFRVSLTAESSRCVQKRVVDKYVWNDMRGQENGADQTTV